MKGSNSLAAEVSLTAAELTVTGTARAGGGDRPVAALFVSIVLAVYAGVAFALYSLVASIL